MENLPVEIIIKITKDLPIVPLTNLGKTCTHLWNILRENIQVKRISLLLRQCYAFGYDELSENKDQEDIDREIYTLIHTNPNLLNEKDEQHNYIQHNYYIFTLKKKFFDMCKPGNYEQLSAYLDKFPILLESDLIQDIMSELHQDYNRD